MATDAINDQQWYHGLLPREDLPEMMKSNGDFLVRSTEPVKGEKRQYVLSVMCDESDKEQGIKHIVIQQNNEKFLLVEGVEFATVVELITFYQNLSDPATNTLPVSLKRPVEKQSWEKSHNDVVLAKKLGEGAFGEVHSGKLTVNGTQISVAVKLAKLEALTKEQIKDIMREARLMRKLDHPNVVKFYGVAANQEPLMVIMELAESGAMDSVVKKAKTPMPVPKKIEICHQVAKGLEYLHENNIIHRDIALRNCLLGNGQAKISDFGMSREGPTYVLGLRKKVPIRWLAPEVMTTRQYNVKSDVWAYGVLCWEAFTNGEEPYRGHKTADVIAKVKGGFRMIFPKTVPDDITTYITRNIWAEQDTVRPAMKDVVVSMQKWAEEHNPTRSPIRAPSQIKDLDKKTGNSSRSKRQKKGPASKETTVTSREAANRHFSVDDVTIGDDKKEDSGRRQGNNITKSKANVSIRKIKKKDDTTELTVAEPESSREKRKVGGDKLQNSCRSKINKSKRIKKK